MTEVGAYGVVGSYKRIRQRRDRELTPVLISNILDKVNARMNATAFQCTLVGSSTLSKNPGQEYAAPIANARCHS